MEQAALEAKVEKTADNLHNLTIQVTEIAGIVKGQQTQRAEDFSTLKEMAAGIKDLNQQMSKTIGMEKDVGALKESQAELKADARVLKHDIGEIKQSMGLLTVHNTEIIQMKSKLEGLESLRDKLDGGATVIGAGAKIFWTVFGGTVVAFIGWAATQYLDRHKTTISSPANIEITAPEETNGIE